MSRWYWHLSDKRTRFNDDANPRCEHQAWTTNVPYYQLDLKKKSSLDWMSWYERWSSFLKWTLIFAVGSEVVRVYSDSDHSLLRHVYLRFIWCSFPSRISRLFSAYPYRYSVSSPVLRLYLPLLTALFTVSLLMRAQGRVQLFCHRE